MAGPAALQFSTKWSSQKQCEGQITIFLVQLPNMNVAVTLPSMVSGMDHAEFCEQRPWVLCQRVEQQLVQYMDEDLPGKSW